MDDYTLSLAFRKEVGYVFAIRLSLPTGRGGAAPACDQLTPTLAKVATGYTQAKCWGWLRAKREVPCGGGHFPLRHEVLGRSYLVLCLIVRFVVLYS